ncbi:hypothetical protein [Acetobacter syzygii]
MSLFRLQRQPAQTTQAIPPADQPPIPATVGTALAPSPRLPC